MQNGPRTSMNTRQPNPGTSFGARKRWQSNPPRDNKPNGVQNAPRNYERYLALAEAQVRAGDSVGAENYYQYAEHYLRSMSPTT
ncbi:MAG: hypothetical protein QOC56_137 [Alphaproteobacteria bacterium]|nr:hypothetical protein [Alphaproteobacteria bacterium]